MDVVGTCPKPIWDEWIREGDAAGDPETGEEWAWWTKSNLVLKIKPGDRFYVVSHGKLRGWATITRIGYNQNTGYWGICRRGGAVACTIPEEIHGFRGIRKRWWDREIEVPFPDWKTP